MWIAEFKLRHEGSGMLEAGRRTGVTIANYYLNSYEENGHEYIYKVCIVSGERKNEFMEAVMHDDRAQVIKIENDQIFYRVPANKAFHHLVLDGTLFFLKPIIAKGGWEYWTLGSLDKAHLKGIYKKVKSLPMKTDIKLLSLKQQPVNFFIPAVFTSLTSRQRRALEAAYNFGYYSFPRKISVEGLADKLKMPRSTFQEHLRKAEVKVYSSLFAQTGAKI